MENLRDNPRYGQWWYSDRPQARFGGELKVDKNDLPELVIRGKQTSLPLMDREPPSQTLFGSFTTEPSLREVSVLGAWHKRGPHGTSPPHDDRETEIAFYARYFLIGAHVNRANHRFIDRVIFGLTGLDEWCDTTGFGGRDKFSPPKATPKNALGAHAVRVWFKSSTSRYFDIAPGRQLRFLSGYEGPHHFRREKNVVLREKNRIEIAFAKRVSIEQAVDEMRLWQTFISFALRIPVFFEDIVLLKSKRGKRLQSMELIVPEKRWELPKQKGLRFDILFNRSRLGRKVGTCLKAWRNKQETIGLAVTLFRGACYLNDVYVHTNVLTYLQALEVFHRELYKADKFPTGQEKKDTLKALRAAIPSTLPSALQKDISEGLGQVGSLTLRDRLKALFRLYPKCLTPLFPREKDLDSLRHARNFLTHYGESGGLTKDFLWSREVYETGEKARLFLEICFLGVMGMTDDEIYELLNEFGPYRDWCRHARTRALSTRRSKKK